MSPHARALQVVDRFEANSSYPYARNLLVEQVRLAIEAAEAAAKADALESAMAEVANVANDFPKGGTVENAVCYVLKKAMDAIRALAGEGR